MLLKLHRISPADVRAVMEQFEALDLDGSGSLDHQDVLLARAAAKAKRRDRRRRLGAVPGTGAGNGSKGGAASGGADGVKSSNGFSEEAVV